MPAGSYELPPLDLEVFVQQRARRLVRPRIHDVNTGAPETIESSAQRRVLVVDDSELTRDLIVSVLRDRGYHILEAVNGQEGLVRYKAGNPDIILTDLDMPIMDGFELLAHIRMDPRFRDIPVIVVTAKELDADDRIRLEGNVSKILQKGAYKRDALMAEIRRLIAHSTGMG